MWRVEYDLTCLTCEELIEARAQMQGMIEAIAEQKRAEQNYLTAEEKQLIAQALAIDEITGEWDAGA